MIYNENQQPLVSIVIVTYNSSKYVIETLESAKNQTYSNIELIISDDFSTDNTFHICKDWIKLNNERFVRTQLINPDNNTGISANCNRGLKAAKGKWIKFIAGDDILLENCILSNINRINEISEEVQVLHSNVLYFNNNILSRSNRNSEVICNKRINASEQLSLFVRGIVPIAPSVFFNAYVLDALNGFDETLPYEDGPMWIKLTSNNFKLHYLDDVTVKYRIHDSVSNSKNDSEKIFKSIYVKDKIVFDKVIQPYLPKFEVYSTRITYKIKDLFSRYNMNRKTIFNIFLFNILNGPFYLSWLLIVKLLEIKIKIRIKLKLK